MTEPDWNKLTEISRGAALESQQPSWNMERCRALCAEAEAATNGNPEFTEFMARYKP